MDDPGRDTHWERWLEESAPRFLLFARQRARSEADAQDLVQEAVLEAARRQGGLLPPDPALVFATIHRRAIDLARRTERRVGREQAVMELQGGAWFDTSPEDRELGQFIEEAMNRLPAKYRDVITLKIWGQLTFSQIAVALGIPANTAASRYRYGLAELRRLTRQVLA